MEPLGATRSILDDQLAVLSHVKRRQLLLDILEANPLEIESVDGNGPSMHSERRDHLIEMHHRHLPKLEAHGLIRWDREAGVVTKGPQFDEIRPLIELLDAHRDELPGA